MYMKISLILAAIYLTGCGARGEAANTDGVERHPKADNAPIDLYIGEKPTRPTKTIGFFKGDGDASEIVARARRAARGLGGDAVIFTETHQETQGYWNMNPGRSSVYQTGLVVIYTDGLPPNAQPSPVFDQDGKTLAPPKDSSPGAPWAPGRSAQ